VNAGRTPASNDAVTLLAGSTFCRSGRNGDSVADAAQGFFYLDTRIISSWHILLDGHPVEPLAVAQPEPSTAIFFARARPRQESEESTVLVERRRRVANSMREDIRIRNFRGEPLKLALELQVAADFADLFDVKEGRAVDGAHSDRSWSGDELRLTRTVGERSRGIRVQGRDAVAGESGLRWQVTVPTQQDWHAIVQALPSVDGAEVVSSFPAEDEVQVTVPTEQVTRRRHRTPTFRCDHPVLQTALDTSGTDLASLLMSNPHRSDLPLVAAGAPWFMALFGRDALITSWLTLAWNPRLARGTLDALAKMQGTK